MSKKPNVRHSSENPRWGSPIEAIDVAQQLWGVTTVDPFSEARFNRIVQAATYLTGEKGVDGFKDPWLKAFDDMGHYGICPRADHILAGFPDIAKPTVATEWTGFVNPPGSDDGENVKRAWRLLDAYHELGWLGGGAIWVAFNLNQFQTLQGESRRSPLHGDFLRCVPDHRLPFTPVEETDEREQPSHPCFFALLPAHDPVSAAEQARIFTDMGSKLGEVF